MTTHFAAIGSDLMAVYGLGETEEAAIADARAQARDAEAQFSAVPISASAAAYVEQHSGEPDAQLTVTRRGVSLAIDVGTEVESGEGEDHDTGRVLEISGEKALVSWVGGACRTWHPLANLSAL